MFRICCCAVAIVGLGLAPQARADYTPLTIADCRDFVFDGAGILYASSGSQIVRYDTKTNAYLPSWTLGGTLMGIDLSPDGTTLAVADATTQGSANRIFLVNTATGTPTSVGFTRNSGESGTFMVAWGADNCVLSTSSANGSSSVPLRCYDPATGSATVLRSVGQDTMLTPNADRKFISYAECNSSSGPIGLYDVTSGSVVATGATNKFLFEAAVNPAGNQMVIPTSFGAYIYDRSGASLVARATVLGQDAVHGPVGAVYSPFAPQLYTCEYESNNAMASLKVYDTQTWQQIATLDSFRFPGGGAGGLGRGRVEVSPDGLLLAVSDPDGLRLYSVPEPATLSLLVVAALGVWRGRRGGLTS